MKSFFKIILSLLLCFSADVFAQNITDTNTDKASASNSEHTTDSFVAKDAKEVGVDPLEDIKNRAAAGDVEAQLNLGYMYLYGKDGVTVDYKQALAYYSAAAEQNSAVAYNNLGSLYFNGVGTDVDYFKAIDYFKKATELGSHDAAVNLSIIYLNSATKINTKDDYKTIISLLEQAQSDNDIAKYLLGYAYYKGFVVAQNYRKAFALIKKAADAQYDEAQYVLAELYIKGLGTTKNYNRAIQYLQAAADQGNPPAIMLLADILAEGKIYTQDIKKAHVLYNISAVMGENDAAEKRDALEKNLKIEDLLEIQATAENYKAEPSAQTTFIRQTYGDSLKVYIDNNLQATQQLQQ